MYVVKLYINIYNMHMYVYCPYNESQNECLNFEFFYSNLKFDISIPNYYFGFSKLIILVWKLLIESKNGHFNFESCYLNLKIDISILEIVI